MSSTMEENYSQQNDEWPEMAENGSLQAILFTRATAQSGLPSQGVTGLENFRRNARTGLVADLD
jgi:hypothetical protein